MSGKKAGSSSSSHSKIQVATYITVVTFMMSISTYLILTSSNSDRHHGSTSAVTARTLLQESGSWGRQSARQKKATTTTTTTTEAPALAMEGSASDPPKIPDMKTRVSITGIIEIPTSALADAEASDAEDIEALTKVLQAMVGSDMNSGLRLEAGSGAEEGQGLTTTERPTTDEKPWWRTSPRLGGDLDSSQAVATVFETLKDSNRNLKMTFTDGGFELETVSETIRIPFTMDVEYPPEPKDRQTDPEVSGTGI